MTSSSPIFQNWSFFLAEQHLKRKNLKKKWSKNNSPISRKCSRTLSEHSYDLEHVCTYLEHSKIGIHWECFKYEVQFSAKKSVNEVKYSRTSLKSRVGAPANYNYQSATCPPDPSTLEITELNSKKCSVAPNSLRVSYHNSHMSVTWHMDPLF